MNEMKLISYELLVETFNLLIELFMKNQYRRDRSQFLLLVPSTHPADRRCDRQTHRHTYRDTDRLTTRRTDRLTDR